MSTRDSEHDPLIDELPSRYIVGIDLGTTNSAVTYVDTEKKRRKIDVFEIPQLVAPGEVEARETLPSFHYQPIESENAAVALKLPWHSKTPKHAVGVYAREDGAKTAGRVISSAKSWLCHAGVDRLADLLPWNGADDVDKLSPVEVSARYLRHVREAWDAKFRKEPLAKQDIVLTLPASFDEVARELTVKAAAEAGLARIVLIEEPQAAFYAWVYKHAKDWEKHVTAGQKILVCDIGGGTTDFTLIRVRRSDASVEVSADETDEPANASDSGSAIDSGSATDSGNAADRNPTDCNATDTGARKKRSDQVQFHRVAVGNHLILGGDNLDLALARFVEPKLSKGKQLSVRQWDVLANRCRRAKEELLSEEAPDRVTVNLPGGGAKLIGGGLKAEVTRQDIEKLLGEGFIPKVSLEEKPQLGQSGFQEFGLPYASDPAITKYLASFLRAHRHAGDEGENQTDDLASARPDTVLFNGGFFASPYLRNRLLDVLKSWFDGDKDWEPLVLDNDRLDLAVARGATYYGLVRRGEGVRIAASLARSYYISVQNDNDQPVAVCLVPGNAEPGQDVTLDRTFRLKISQPVEFPLFVSSTRLVDKPGDIIPIDREQMAALPPIRTVIKPSRRSETGEVSVELYVRLTEIGTIDLWCREKEGERSWRLQFDIRSTTQTDIEAHETSGEIDGFVADELWSECQQAIESVFGPEGNEKPAALVKSLTKILELDRTEWPMSLLRRIWEGLMDIQDGRKKSSAHEARWLNLLGFTLRPGYGFAVDDWRVTETWRHVRGKLTHGTQAIQNELLILWRRVAGGFSAGQQLAVAEPLLAPVRNLHRRSTGGQSQGVSLKPEDATEILRLLGSLELLPTHVKSELGNMLVDLLPKRKFQNVRDPIAWTLGRLGQRIPIYGPLNSVVSTTVAQAWLSALMELDEPTPTQHLAVMQIARKTDDRHRDVTEKTRTAVLDWMRDTNADESLVALVREFGKLDQSEQRQVFGESLPQGLKLE